MDVDPLPLRDERRERVVASKESWIPLVEGVAEPPDRKPSTELGGRLILLPLLVRVPELYLH